MNARRPISTARGSIRRARSSTHCLLYAGYFSVAKGDPKRMQGWKIWHGWIFTRQSPTMLGFPRSTGTASSQWRFRTPICRAALRPVLPIRRSRIWHTEWVTSTLAWTRQTMRLLGLAFILVIHEQHFRTYEKKLREASPVTIAQDVMASTAFKSVLAALPGYDVALCGTRLDVHALF